MFNIKNTPSVILHLLSWLIVVLIVLSAFYNKFNYLPNDDFFYYRLFLNIVIFYLNFSFLVPKLLLNKKIGLYIFTSFTFFLFFLFIYLNVLPSIKLISNVEKFSDFQNKKLFFEGFIQGIVIFLLFAISLSIKLSMEWYKNEKIKNLIETQKLNAELSFLKSQLNPHFLFNSLNSIYSLANKKSDLTTDAIITLAELMRYMVYETNKGLVSLQNEIDYIKNYISLQNLRLKDSSGVRINIQGNLDHNIEPLLLITFIENAFKYGTDFTGKTFVDVRIIVEGNNLSLNVSNYISQKENSNFSSGIGLENIKNRLNLLYPNSHNLIIEKSNNLFNVALILKLKK
ncbi:sensor histidine kinase [Lutibacter sp.]|uniref:sensor histidine kinase n=1 Tax=Lutibacter sp. TaxID=1925666 RepID=UPI0035636BE5